LTWVERFEIKEYNFPEISDQAIHCSQFNRLNARFVVVQKGIWNSATGRFEATRDYTGIKPGQPGHKNMGYEAALTATDAENFMLFEGAHKGMSLKRL
jgi:hypothetical protein